MSEPNIRYRVIPVTPYQQNCSVLYCEHDKIAAIIDPGGDIQDILDVVNELQLKVEFILLTHGHLDHVGGAQTLADQLQVQILGPQREDAFWLKTLEQQSQYFGFEKTLAFEPDRWLEDGDTLHLGKHLLQVIHCPGHTPGHVVFFCAKAKLAWVGDVLFKQSIGRTDFPKGNHQTLLNSITQKLWPLGHDVRFIPGHGPESTFGAEMRDNPYVGDYA